MRLGFEHGKINFTAVRAGDRIWKTDDPQLNRELRRSWSAELEKPKRTLDLAVSGKAGEPLRLEGRCLEIIAQVESAQPLQRAEKRPLNDETLRGQLGRLGETGFALGTLEKPAGGRSHPAAERAEPDAARTDRENWGRCCPQAGPPEKIEEPDRPETTARRLHELTLRPRDRSRGEPAFHRALPQPRADRGGPAPRAERDLRRFRGHPPLRRGGRAGAQPGPARRRARRADFPGHAAHPEGG